MPIYKRVIFVFNPKSGNSFRIKEDLKKIKNILSARYSQLEYAECSILSSELSELIVRYEKETCLFVACGGDGTVTAVAEKIFINPLFFFSVMPYGTGNDFSRVIGIYKQAKDLEKMAAIFAGENKTIINFDLWRIEKKIFLNYFSLGYDAVVVDRFQKIRGYLPDLIRRPFVNRVLYLFSGVFHLFSSIPSGAMIKYGDKKIALAGCKALVLTNINSYAGGKPLAQAVVCTDNQLNIFRLRSLWSMFRLVVGGGCVGQGELSNSLVLSLGSDAMCQIDGEPHPISKGEHRIDFIGNIKVLGV